MLRVLEEHEGTGEERVAPIQGMAGNKGREVKNRVRSRSQSLFGLQYLKKETASGSELPGGDTGRRRTKCALLQVPDGIVLVFKRVSGGRRRLTQSVVPPNLLSQETCKY